MTQLLTTIKIIGQRMKVRRSQLGLPQREVAAMVHISRSHYGNWETGKVKGFRVADLQLVANALRVPIAYFFPPDEDEWAPEGDIGAYFAGVPPEMQPHLLEMVKAAHNAAKASETTVGRKAE